MEVTKEIGHVCWKCGYEGELDGDRCPVCDAIHPYFLEIGAQYQLGACKHRRRVPVMPWHYVPAWVKILPFSVAQHAIQSRINYLREGALFCPTERIIKKGRNSQIPWYAAAAENAGMGFSGWIDAAALIGWELERLPE